MNQNSNCCCSEGNEKKNSCCDDFNRKSRFVRDFIRAVRKVEGDDDWSERQAEILQYYVRILELARRDVEMPIVVNLHGIVTYLMGCPCVEEDENKSYREAMTRLNSKAYDLMMREEVIKEFAEGKESAAQQRNGRVNINNSTITNFNENG